MVEARERWWPVSGIVFVLLFVIGFALIGDSGDNAAEVLAFYRDNEERLIVAFFLLAASALAYLWFVATLRSILARAEPQPRALTELGFAGGLATAVLLIAGASPIAALTDGADQFEAGGGGGAYALNSMAYPLLTVGIAASSFLALALALVALRGSSLPRWLGWVSLVAAPIIFVAPLFIPVFLFLAWVLVVSVALLMPRIAMGSQNRLE